MTHQFTVTVTTDKSREAARLALLLAWASRNPDGCSFDFAEDDGERMAEIWTEILNEDELRLKGFGGQKKLSGG